MYKLSSNKVLFLYSEFMGYNKPLLRAMVRDGYDVTLVFWDKNKVSSSPLPSIEGVRAYRRTRFDIMLFCRLLFLESWSLVYISGWMDLKYLLFVFFRRVLSGKVVLGMDTFYDGRFRQKIFSLVLRHVNRLFFTDCWVPGERQVSYAQMLGFKSENIFSKLYCCDQSIFASSEAPSVSRAGSELVFAYVGRNTPVKRLDLLTCVWQKNKSWHDRARLLLIGDGCTKYDNREKSILTYEFLEPEILKMELTKVDCLIIPSDYEPWGLVVHEFASLGCIIVSSDAVGSSQVFVKQGFNGFFFEAGDPLQLEDCINKVLSLDKYQIKKFKAFSSLLSKRINVDMQMEVIKSLSSC